MVNKKKKGFTIVELSLSIAFIGTLSIIVVVMINNAVASYHRGIILNEVNTVGMDLVEDMRLSVQNSEAKKLMNECNEIYYNDDSSNAADECKEDGAKSFVTVVKYADVKVGNSDSINAPVYGAFCTGSHSYLWNSGYFFARREGENIKIENSNWLTLKYKLNDETATATANEFRLLKVKDEGRWVCKSLATDGNGYVDMDNPDKRKNLTNKADISSHNIGEEPKDILAEESGLTMYDLSAIVSMSDNNRSMFYSASFILGTIRGGINVMATGDYCTPPGSLNTGVEAFNYCAINKFNFAATATGG